MTSPSRWKLERLWQLWGITGPVNRRWPESFYGSSTSRRALSSSTVWTCAVIVQRSTTVTSVLSSKVSPSSTQQSKRTLDSETSTRSGTNRRSRKHFTLPRPTLSLNPFPKASRPCSKHLDSSRSHTPAAWGSTMILVHRSTACPVARYAFPICGYVCLAFMKAYSILRA